MKFVRIGIVAIITAISLLAVAPFAWGAVEDLTSYTETDSTDNFTVTATKIEFTDYDPCKTSGYQKVYKDFGAGYFNTDFHLRYEYYLDVASDTSNAYFFTSVFTNSTNNNDWDTNSLAVRFDRGTTVNGTLNVNLYDFTKANRYGTTQDVGFGTLYYFDIAYDADASENGTITMNITTGDYGGSNLASELVVPLENAFSYRYFVILGDDYRATTPSLTGYIQNVEFLPADALSSLTASSVTGGYASISGNVTSASSNGSLTLCWDTSDKGTTSTDWSYNKTIDSNVGVGEWESYLNGLSAETLYYTKAFFTNDGGTIYSATANLTTTAVSLPSGTTSDPNDWTSTSFVALGTLIDTGGENCTIGFQYGLLSGGVYTDNVTTSANATVGDFSDNITGLTPGTGYIFRAFFENTAGIAYSENGTYILAPTLDTLVASNIEETTATISGNITNTGGENADYRGFVWSLSAMGDPGDTAPSESWYTSYNTTSGSYSTGVFSYNMTGLSGGVTYYVRSVAHNSAGWSYGDEISFLTKPSQPSGLTASAGKSIMQSLLPIAIALAGVIVVFFFKGNWVVLLTTVVFVIASIVLVNALINAA